MMAFVKDIKRREKEYERLLRKRDNVSKIRENEQKHNENIINLYEWGWENRIYCSECSAINDTDSNYCVECGHKLQKIVDENIDKKYCTICGEKVDIDKKYCSNYGHEIKLKSKIKKCEVCGEWIDDERYCINCGHDTIERSPLQFKDKSFIDLKREKKCPNCNHEYQRYYNYCHWCGEKLIRK